jgi:predicted dehydrogenase
MKQERKLRFFQRDAYITMDFQAKQVRVLKKSADIMKYLPQILMGSTDIKPEQLIDMQTIDVSDSPKDALSMELESFVDCIANHKTPIVDGAAGTRALDIALIIIKQIQTKNQRLS